MLGWDQPIPFLSQEEGTITLFGLSIGVPTALIMVILFEAWKSFPFAFLFILARLQAVPGDIEEAARVDGAAPTQVFRHIILPQLDGRDRADRRPALHLDVQRVRRDLPADGRRARGPRCWPPRSTRSSRRATTSGPSAAVAMFMAAVLAILLLVYLKFFGERERET